MTNPNLIITVIFAEKIATKIVKTTNWSATILPLKLLLFLSAFLSKKTYGFLAYHREHSRSFFDSQSTNHKPLFLLS